MRCVPEFGFEPIHVPDGFRLRNHQPIDDQHMIAPPTAPTSTALLRGGTRPPELDQDKLPQRHLRSLKS